MSTGPYIGSSTSFFMGLRTSADAGEGEGKRNFKSSLSGSGFESIISQHSSQPQLPPQVEQPRPQPQPTEDGSTNTYLPPARPSTRAFIARATGTCALVGFEGGVDINVTSTASFSLRRSGSGQGVGVEGFQGRIRSQDRGQSRSRGVDPKRRRRNYHR